MWGPLESLYEPGKPPIPTWDAGTRADQADDKSNMLVLPDGRTRLECRNEVGLYDNESSVVGAAFIGTTR